MDESELRRAAFGDRPGADVRPAVLSEVPRERWLAAVVLGARGHYAAAATVLTALVRGADPVIASLAGSALASHRRQLGAHAAARRLDAAALARLGDAGRTDAPDDPHGIGARGARTDALTGLAADALGAGRPDVARRVHAAAVASAAPGDWRAEVRLGWVAAEIDLATGAAEAAAGHAERAAATARDVGAVRHVLKSEVVAAVASLVTGTAEVRKTAVDLLLCDLNHIKVQRLRSLAWPVALVLAEHAPERAPHALDDARSALSCVLTRADPALRAAATRSPWIPTALLRSGEPPNADTGSNFLTD
ncbi:hypothetical protein [Umezawaea beigongshangensis]|uniref:hypothetical protein n=1 Tax=Umezawaea beigongshangensis TaxID=2780383 RepID=UPI0018F1A3AA|nr:hypothetical protein [Umezawaea beigongshangensis]